ncbi:PIG-L family deacetylase [Promicromonospora iranensis]|uniref:N-acetyl-1-D-myo-inositol-2-amino-2-deoxy-alpha-D-glucopyranoside deacetylase n=1 Tax=Promicromonospora iranensis TaxID=1105144 RepID=A0ABU2CSB6_9MICO|nr:PIG-L family deacetylase [Promicromonospora iranensis]MDR7384233.1 N-acetyl-1-D-myo-inositol-2-amino-2-deoxy-alpha-D-glucopyranoside deacetylase [Promicromonospora iranensis]
MHAHPDDETLTTGGLLAAFAAAGRPACVVTCTRGERGEVIALPGTTSEGRAGLEGDGPALGAYRETELAAALTQLGGGGDGAVEHAFLDTLPLPGPRVSGSSRVPDASGGVRYEDSGMTWVAPGVAGPAPDSPPTAFARVPLDEPAGRLATLVRARRPAVVATYEPGGGYGHPDHVRAHQVTVRALELAADPAWWPDGGGAPVGEGAPDAVVERWAAPWAGAELWQAVVPADELRSARATLAAHPEATALTAPESLTFPDPTVPLPPLARPDLAAWSAEGQVVGSSGCRSSDVLPITRSGRVVRVDIAGVVGRVVGGLRAHASQVQHATVLARPEDVVAGWYALSNGVLAPILTFETYLVGSTG